MVNHHWHECSECGFKKRIGAEGVRTMGGCPNCGEVQSFENLEC